MFQEISPEQLYLLRQSGKTIIDVRTPKEFKEGTLPGAINIPLFTDSEHAKIGTIYKQKGQEEAKELGLEIYSKKLPQFINMFKPLKQPLTVFCFRGGMRSKTAAAVLDLMNYNVSRLTGGIKGYYNFTRAQLEVVPIPKLFVLNGHTGSGKTHMLRTLKKEGYPVIDLEEMAKHRGSVFGQIGITPTNQKTFDLHLAEALLYYQDAPYILIEGESSRIGKIKIPDRFYNIKEQSQQLFIHLPVSVRIDLILADYDPLNNHDQFVEAFSIIKRRIHTPIAKRIEIALSNHDYRNVVRDLLDYYYDPRYSHSIDYKEELITPINAETTTDILDLIKYELKKYEEKR